VFPPPIFTGTASISVFRVSPPPFDRDRRGGLYIGFLGQAERLEKKMDGSGGSRPKQDRVARPGKGPAPPRLIWTLGLVLLTSSPPGASRGKILTPEKS
jgi:hypothetical protein